MRLSFRSDGSSVGAVAEGVSAELSFGQSLLLLARYQK